MDLSTLSTKQKSEDGVVMEVEDPRDGDPLLDEDGNPVTITVAGSDSKAYRTYSRKAQNKRLKNLKPGQRKIDLDAAEMEEEQLNLLVECTLDWDGIAWEGKPLECTKPNAKMLYTELGWLRDQVDAYMADRTNFFGS